MESCEIEKHEMKSTIPCKACNGTGHAPLPSPYLDTIDAFGKRRLCSCADLRATLLENGKLDANKPEVNETIVHKRVLKMVRWGVLKKVKQVTPKKNGREIRLHRAWVFERV